MNEQFSRLYHLAWNYAELDPEYQENPTYERRCVVQSRIFAELIVQECCKTLEEMHMWQSVNNQNYPSAWHDAVDQGIDNIKEHFGVGE